MLYLNRQEHKKQNVGFSAPSPCMAGITVSRLLWMWNCFMRINVHIYAGLLIKNVEFGINGIYADNFFSF